MLAISFYSLQHIYLLATKNGYFSRRNVRFLFFSFVIFSYALVALVSWYRTWEYTSGKKCLRTMLGCVYLNKSKGSE